MKLIEGLALGLLGAVVTVWAVVTVAVLLTGLRRITRGTPGGRAAVLAGLLGVAAAGCLVAPVRRWLLDNNARFEGWPDRLYVLSAAGGILWLAGQASLVAAVGAAWRRLDALGEADRRADDELPFGADR